MSNMTFLPLGTMIFPPPTMKLTGGSPGVGVWRILEAYEDGRYLGIVVTSRHHRAMEHPMEIYTHNENKDVFSTITLTAEVPEDLVSKCMSGRTAVELRTDKQGPESADADCFLYAQGSRATAHITDIPRWFLLNTRTLSISVETGGAFPFETIIEMQPLLKTWEMVNFHQNEIAMSAHKGNICKFD